MGWDIIDARQTDALVWSETYDQELASVFDLQTAIARAIADQLQARLSPREASAVARPNTRELGASVLYRSTNGLMQAGFGNEEQDPESGWRKAIGQLEQAVALDPAFVQAHARLSEAHAFLYFYGYDTTEENREAIRRSAENALRANPEAGEAHRAMGIYYYYAPRDFDAARAELLQAAHLLPNDARTFLYLGLIERRQGHWEAALDFFRRAASLDPQEPDTFNKVADTLRGMRRYAEADATFDRALALAPGAAWFHKEKAYVALQGYGDLATARAQLALVPADFDSEGSVTALRIYVALGGRDPAAAARALAASPRTEFAPGVSGHLFPRAWYEGTIARARGDRDAASKAFLAARAVIEPQTRARLTDPRPLMILALLDAALGRREDALREGRQALALRPPEKDAYSGPPAAVQLAVVYAWTGETALAIDALRSLATRPNGPTYGDLRLNPDWDVLRSDPRFAALLTSLAPPEKLTRRRGAAEAEEEERAKTR